MNDDPISYIASPECGGNFNKLRAITSELEVVLQWIGAHGVFSVHVVQAFRKLGGHAIYPLIHRLKSDDFGWERIDCLC